MSVSIMSLVFNAEIPDLKYTKKGKDRTAKASTVTLVLLAYADHANENGEGAYPGYRKLQQKTKLSAQGLSDTIDALIQNKIMTPAGRSKVNTKEYSINVEKLKEYLKPLENRDSSHLTNVSQATRAEPSVKPPEEPKESNSAKTRTPKEKPLKANQIPEIILFRELTRRYPSKGSQYTVITSVTSMGDRLGRAPTVQDLEPFYREWCDRGYNPVSIKWLSEWAVSGNIPQNGKRPARQVEPVKQETPEQLAARKEIARQLLEYQHANV